MTDLRLNGSLRAESSPSAGGADAKQTAAQKAADNKLKKVCADFESIFTYQLMKSMRKNIPGGGILPKSSGRENWEMMMDQHVAEALSRKGQGIGIQTVLYNQMKKRLKVSE